MNEKSEWYWDKLQRKPIFSIIGEEQMNPSAQFETL